MYVSSWIYVYGKVAINPENSRYEDELAIAEYSPQWSIIGLHFQVFLD